MKSTSLGPLLWACGLITTPLLLSSTKVIAAPAPAAAGALRAIEGNADAARANAATYQWKRVNYEVERVIAAERRLERAAAGDGALAAQIEPLRQAVTDLRAGRAAHDRQRTMDAAERVSTLCAQTQK